MRGRFSVWSTLQMSMLDRLFYLYMSAVGIVAGIALVMAPWTANGTVKPFFWILIAVALFDVVAYARGRNAPGTMITSGARAFGFLAGGAVMLVITLIAGVQVPFF
jgi:hypothetical protein